MRHKEKSKRTSKPTQDYIKNPKGEKMTKTAFKMRQLRTVPQIMKKTTKIILIKRTPES